MKALVATLAIAALALGTLSGCKEERERQQADIKKGTEGGQQSRKKVEASVKEGEEQRRKAIDGEK